METIKSILATVWDLVESFTFALAFFVITYLFLFQPGQVYGTSSYPTWKDGERFITDKVSYRFQTPKRGDFVVIKSPRNPDIDFLKRIVGLPGETIEIKSGHVSINLQTINEPYLQSDTYTGPESFLNENQPLRIPDNFYFVLGDNRSHSSDSRDFGPIPSSSIIGKVVFRFWPPDKSGVISSP